MIWVLPFLFLILLYFFLNRNLRENFDDLNYKLVLPSPNEVPSTKFNKNWNQNYQSNLIKTGLQPQNPKLSKLEQIYINPFFPKKTSKKPKQNYPNPKKMGSAEKNAFKFGYPPNLTMQDYVNWLSLFQDTQDLLNLDHKTYFQMLINNQDIPYIHNKIPPPPTRLTPLESDDYFNAQYNMLPQKSNPLFDSFINPQTTVSTNQGRSTILAKNSEDYPDFPNNFDVYGSSGYILNEDLWMKSDPKVLQNFVGPIWLKQNIHPFGNLSP